MHTGGDTWGNLTEGRLQYNYLLNERIKLLQQEDWDVDDDGWEEWASIPWHIVTDTFNRAVQIFYVGYVEIWFSLPSVVLPMIDPERIFNIVPLIWAAFKNFDLPGVLARFDAWAACVVPAAI